MEYLPKGGKILRCYEIRSYACLEYKNRGPGIRGVVLQLQLDIELSLVANRLLLTARNNALITSDADRAQRRGPGIKRQQELDDRFGLESRIERLALVGFDREFDRQHRMLS